MKHWMTRFVTVALSLLLIFSLVGCNIGKNGKSGDTPKNERISTTLGAVLDNTLKGIGNSKIALTGNNTNEAGSQEISIDLALKNGDIDAEVRGATAGEGADDEYMYGVFAIRGENAYVSQGYDIESEAALDAMTPDGVAYIYSESFGSNALFAMLEAEGVSLGEVGAVLESVLRGEMPAETDELYVLLDQLFTDKLTYEKGGSTTLSYTLDIGAINDALLNDGALFKDYVDELFTLLGVDMTYTGIIELMQLFSQLGLTVGDLLSALEPAMMSVILAMPEEALEQLNLSYEMIIDMQENGMGLLLPIILIDPEMGMITSIVETVAELPDIEDDEAYFLALAEVFLSLTLDDAYIGARDILQDALNAQELPFTLVLPNTLSAAIESVFGTLGLQTAGTVFGLFDMQTPGSEAIKSMTIELSVTVDQNQRISGLSIDIDVSMYGQKRSSGTNENGDSWESDIVDKTKVHDSAGNVSAMITYGAPALLDVSTLDVGSYALSGSFTAEQLEDWAENGFAVDLNGKLPQDLIDEIEGFTVVFYISEYDFNKLIPDGDEPVVSYDDYLAAVSNGDNWRYEDGVLTIDAYLFKLLFFLNSEFDIQAYCEFSADDSVYIMFDTFCLFRTGTTNSEW